VARGVDADAAPAGRRHPRDRIDILVDLTGYGGIAPMEVLASGRRPIQASWFGYLSTSGTTRVDYRITDAHADPSGLASARTPRNCCGCRIRSGAIRPPAASAQAGEPPADAALRAQRLRHLRLVQPGGEALADGAPALGRDPEAHAAIAPAGGRHAARPATQALLDEFERNGVARGAVSVEPRLLLPDYFRKLREVDIALDTTPYSGGTTTCDTLWMGTPVVHHDRAAFAVAQRGEHPCGARPARLVASSPEDYVARAGRVGRQACPGSPGAAGTAARLAAHGRSAVSPATWRRSTARCGAPGAPHFPTVKSL
jgi:hypothetical protein